MSRKYERDSLKIEHKKETVDRLKFGYQNNQKRTRMRRDRNEIIMMKRVLNWYQWMTETRIPIFEWWILWNNKNGINYVKRQRGRSDCIDKQRDRNDHIDTWRLVWIDIDEWWMMERKFLYLKVEFNNRSNNMKKWRDMSDLMDKWRDGNDHMNTWRQVWIYIKKWCQSD